MIKIFHVDWITLGQSHGECGIKLFHVDGITLGSKNSKLVFIGHCKKKHNICNRNDAGLAAAELALDVEKHVLESGSIDTVGTVGIMELHPGAINSIPSKSHIVIDTRDIDEKRRNTVIEKIHQSASTIAKNRGVILSE